MTESIEKWLSTALNEHDINKIYAINCNSDDLLLGLCNTVQQLWRAKGCVDYINSGDLFMTDMPIFNDAATMAILEATYKGPMGPGGLAIWLTRRADFLDLMVFSLDELKAANNTSDFLFENKSIRSYRFNFERDNTSLEEELNELFKLEPDDFVTY